MCAGWAGWWWGTSPGSPRPTRSSCWAPVSSAARSATRPGTSSRGLYTIPVISGDLCRFSRYYHKLSAPQLLLRGGGGGGRRRLRPGLDGHHLHPLLLLQLQCIKTRIWPSSEKTGLVSSQLHLQQGGDSAVQLLWAQDTTLRVIFFNYIDSIYNLQQVCLTFGWSSVSCVRLMIA